MSLEQLKKHAKRWLKALRANNLEARARFERTYPGGPANPVLRDVQHALARDRGYENWVALTTAIETATSAAAAPKNLKTIADFERAVNDLLAAFNSKDDAARLRLNAYYQRPFTFEDWWAEIWRRVYAFRQRAFNGSAQQLQLSEAQTLVAQDAGFGSWTALTRALAGGTPPVPAFAIDAQENRIAPRRVLSVDEWDELIAVMKERGITALDASGMMTDAVMARIAALDHVVGLSLGGSRELTDDGLLQLARMPQLQHLNLSEYPGGKLTDRGLEVLRHLPNLRTFEMTWQKGITDAGVANLRFCDAIERVNLMGSPTGDGAIEALQGKRQLHRFSSGRLVTDAGLPLLHNFPMMKQWCEVPVKGDELAGAHLLIDGPFTNAGLAALAGLDGVADLDLFWHVTGITSAGYAHLRNLPNLAAIGADGKLSDNEAMGHFAAIPRLKRLRAQGTVATDAGFEALARSQTLEGLWTGKDTVQLGDRGFTALSNMPSLRRLGVSCKNVSDEALAALPHFPALRELTPIDMTDDGFRHIGRCQALERLTCMYCRQTGDAGTGHIARLSLGYYYAGLTQITDRTLEILGAMPTLEQIELYECLRVTDSGLVFLASLPRLREVQLDASPGVTLEGTRVFPARVRVKYST